MTRARITLRYMLLIEAATLYYLSFATKLQNFLFFPPRPVLFRLYENVANRP